MHPGLLAPCGDAVMNMRSDRAPPAAAAAVTAAAAAAHRIHRGGKIKSALTVTGALITGGGVTIKGVLTGRMLRR